MYRKDDVMSVYRHWQEVMDLPQSRLTDKRRRAVVARFKEGYSVRELKEAIDGCSVTPWNMGDNPRDRKYNDLELICRNGDNVERFVQIAQDQTEREQEHREDGTAEYRATTDSTTEEGQRRLDLLKRRRQRPRVGESVKG